MVNKIQINIGNKFFYTLIAILSLIIFGAVVYAYNSNNPSVFGHTAGELTGVCKSDGTGCPSLGGSPLNQDSCVWRNLAYPHVSSTWTDMSCSPGEYVAGIGGLGYGTNFGWIDLKVKCCVSSSGSGSGSGGVLSCNEVQFTANNILTGKQVCQNNNAQCTGVFYTGTSSLTDECSMPISSAYGTMIANCCKIQ